MRGVGGKKESARNMVQQNFTCKVANVYFRLINELSARLTLESFTGMLFLAGGREGRDLFVIKYLRNVARDDFNYSSGSYSRNAAILQR